MERIIHTNDTDEIICPFVSGFVNCDECDSPNFSIDSQGERPYKNKVPGRCDDCGHVWGIKVEPTMGKGYVSS